MGHGRAQNEGPRLPPLPPPPPQAPAQPPPPPAANGNAHERATTSASELTVDEVLDLAPSALRLTQTCGLPLVSTQRGRVRAVATPCYAAAGNEDGGRPLYCSVVVVQEGDAAASAADLAGATVAVNSPNSLSGTLLFDAFLGGVASRVVRITTGAHVDSMAAVAAGRARAAAVDAVTFALLQRHRPEAVRGLRVLGRTPTMPALPFVTHASASDAEVDTLRRAFRTVADQVRAGAAAAPVAAAFDALGLRDVDTSGQWDEAAYERAIDALRASVAAAVDAAADYTVPAPLKQGTADSDGRFLAELAQLVARESAAVAPDALEATQLAQLWTSLPGNRRARILWPAGTRPAAAVLDAAHAPAPAAAAACCVGFFGTRHPQHFLTAGADADVAACWGADAELVDRLDPDVIAAYCVAEREPGGDWANLVLLRGNGAALDNNVEAFKTNNPVHSHATSRIAPRYYSSVRIHRALLWQAGGGGNAFQSRVVRTLQVEYAPPVLNRAPERHVHTWLDVQ